MNTYDKQSIEFLQKEFKNRGSVDLIATDDEFDAVDVYYHHDDSTHYAEVKNRNCKKAAYADTFIELDKFKALRDCKGGLIILFTDCWVVYSGNDLVKSTLYVDQKGVSKKTCFENHNLVLKTFVHFRLDTCKTFNY